MCYDELMKNKLFQKKRYHDFHHQCMIPEFEEKKKFCW